jgi:hypothetical protein
MTESTLELLRRRQLELDLEHSETFYCQFWVQGGRTYVTVVKARLRL